MKKTNTVGSAEATVELVKRKRRKKHTNTFALTMLALPAIIWFLIFSYAPMAGSLIAFKNFKPKLGFFESEWVGL